MLELRDTPTRDNPPVTEMANSVESSADVVFSVTTQTRYNAEGQPLTSTQKQLISQLSHTLENKSVFVSERGLTSFRWTEYSGGTKRVQYSTVPGSSITAETMTVDGVVRSQKDPAGITTTATRPLAIQKDGTWFSAPARLAKQGFRSQVCSRLGGWLLKPHPAYGWDLTKNICELYGPSGYTRASYSYSPYGLPSQSTNGASSDDVTQPIQWSSEFNDTELALVYYNFRHYNPVDGRWMERDPFTNNNSYKHLYVFVNNKMYVSDILGLQSLSDFNISTCCKVKKLKAYVQQLGKKGIILEDITNKTVKGYDSLAQARKKNPDNPRRHVIIEIHAEFEQMDAECCTIQQYVSNNGKTFREDVDSQGGTYGPRTTPTKNSEREAMKEDAYLYYNVLSQGNVFPNNERGEYYRSVDYPATSSTNPKEKWMFKIVVTDTCNKNKEVSSIYYTIDWS